MNFISHNVLDAAFVAFRSKMYDDISKRDHYVQIELCKYNMLYELHICRKMCMKWHYLCVDETFKNGNINIIQYLHEHGQYISGLFVKSFNIEHARYLIQNILCVSEFTYQYAAFIGDIESLQYLHTHYGYRWDYSVYNKCDNLECVKFLHEHYYPWDCNAYYPAILNGDIEIIKYLHTNGCPIFDDNESNMWHTMGDFTTSFPNIFASYECFEYLLDIGWHYEINNTLFQCSDVDRPKYIRCLIRHNKTHALVEKACMSFYIHNNIDWIRDLIMNGIPFNKSDCRVYLHGISQALVQFNAICDEYGV